MAGIKLFTVNLVIERNAPLHLLETNVSFFPFLWLVAKMEVWNSQRKTGEGSVAIRLGAGPLTSQCLGFLMW